jgi:hypothetical protein
MALKGGRSFESGAPIRRSTSNVCNRKKVQISGGVAKTQTGHFPLPGNFPWTQYYRQPTENMVGATGIEPVTPAV